MGNKMPMVLWSADEESSWDFELLMIGSLDSISVFNDVKCTVARPLPG
jgi:hypothetical protein